MKHLPYLVQRVSSWQIEPAVSPPTINPVPVPRSKRTRPAMVLPSPDSSVLTKEGSYKVTADPSPASGFSRILQGQELSTLRACLADSNDSDTVEKPVVWSNTMDAEKSQTVVALRKCGSENWVPSLRPEPTYADLLSGLGTCNDLPARFCSPFADQTPGVAPMKKHFSDQEGKFNMFASSWSILPACLLLNSESSMKISLQGSDMPYQVRGNVKCGGISEYHLLLGQKAEHHNGSWMMPWASPFPSENPAHSRDVLQKPILVQHESVKPKGGNYELFGIPLISKPVTPEPTVSLRPTADEPVSQLYSGLQRAQTFESDQRSGHSKGSEPMDNLAAGNGPEKLSTCKPVSKDSEGKCHGSSTRSCTKVHKQGIALGRSVDLCKFQNYDEVVAELDHLFDFNGELMAPNMTWLVVYTDDEGDVMLVGDDPWEKNREFCGMVRKIFIYTKEEVQKMSPGTLNSKSEESPSVTEGSNGKEVKQLMVPSVSSANIP